MKKSLNEGNQIHNVISSPGSETVINYGSGSGFDFVTSYGCDSGSGSGSTSQKVTVPTVPVPVPVPQRCYQLLFSPNCSIRGTTRLCIVDTAR